MSISPIISTYLFPFVGLVFLLVFAGYNPMLKKRQTILFVIAIAVNIVLIIATSLDYVFATLKYENFWLFRRITSFINFAAGPIIPLILYKIFNEKKNRWFFYIPLTVNFAICFISMFFQIVFYISPANGYGRGPLFILPFATSLIYIILMIFQPIRNHVHSKKMERYFLLAVVFLLMLGMFLEVQMRFRFMDWTCTALSLILYYLLLNIHTLIVDPLTGAYNRLSYSKALDKMEKSKTTCLALIDINEFKAVNDTYGHDVGDRFLATFVGVFNKSLSGHSSLYRIGGDEFALISKNMSFSEFKKMIQDIQAQEEIHHIYFAWGAVEYHPGHDNQEELVKMADQFMYQRKAEMKRITRSQADRIPLL